MKLKLNKDGSAVVRDGKPVYVHANGREEAFDAPAAWKLALGKHFETSPTMTGLKIPHDLAAAAFSDALNRGRQAGGGRPARHAAVLAYAAR